jgi:hypothetical protein
MTRRDMTEDDWRELLLQAAERGSDYLRDTWAEIPEDMRDGLGFALRQAGIIAMGADAQRMAE